MIDLQPLGLIIGFLCGVCSMWIATMIGVFARSDDKKHQAEGTTLPTNTRRPHRYDLSQKPSVAPTHIAVIMDGNRRYGNRVHRDALKGHWDGGKTLTDFIQWCMNDDVKILTVYAFSSENWKRDPKEIDALMKIFAKYADSFAKEAVSRNVKVAILSTDFARLPAAVQRSVESLVSATSDCSGFLLNICLSYGGREDVLLACNSLVSESRSSGITPDIDAATFASRLCTGAVPDPDVLIRTSGEQRISNFLLWQTAYTELFFVDKNWPDMTRDDLRLVLHQFADRNRRYGG